MQAPVEALVARLYAESLPRLGGFAYALTADYARAEELVQAALVKTLVARPRVDDLAALEGYVRAAMRTLHIDGIRREARWRVRMPRLARDDHAAAADSGVDDRDEVARALSQLPARVRTAVALYYWDDLSVADVAAAMDVSAGTVKGYLRDGRERLGDLLGTAESETDRVRVTEVRP